MKKKEKTKSNPPSQRTVEAPAMGPSPAWEKLRKVKPWKRQDDTRPHKHFGHDVIPGKCTCKDEEYEDNGVRGVIPRGDGSLTVVRVTPKKSVTHNPWTHGHAYWCSMFMAKCPDCGLSSGTHTWNCAFWTKHPTISPF